MTSIIKVDQIQLADGTAPTAADLGFAAGSVLQVTHSKTSSFITVTSTSFAATGISGTITPTKSTSKILVLASVNGVYKNGTNMYLRTQIFRNSSLVFHQQEIAGYTNSASAGSGNIMSHHLDSPNSTSLLTYEVYGQVSSGAAYINNQNSGRAMESGITLIEIAG